MGIVFIFGFHSPNSAQIDGTFSSSKQPVLSFVDFSRINQWRNKWQPTVIVIRRYIFDIQCLFLSPSSSPNFSINALRVLTNNISYTNKLVYTINHIAISKCKHRPFLQQKYTHTQTHDDRKCSIVTATANWLAAFFIVATHEQKGNSKSMNKNRLLSIEPFK